MNCTNLPLIHTIRFLINKCYLHDYKSITFSINITVEKYVTFKSLNSIYQFQTIEMKNYSLQLQFCFTKNYKREKSIESLLIDSNLLINLKGQKLSC